MTKRTAQLIALALDGDDTVTEEERNRILGTGGEQNLKLQGLVTRRELATLARRSVKWVDRFTRDNPSVFVRVRKEGASRSIGFTRESVARFLSGSGLD